MLCCIVCSKQGDASVETVEDDGIPRSPAAKEGLRSLSSQVKDIAVKLAYRHCRPCTSAAAIHQQEEGNCIDSLGIDDAASDVAASNSHQFATFFSTPFHGSPAIGVGRQSSGHVRKNGHNRVAFRTVASKSPELRMDHFSKRLPSSPTTAYEIPVEDVEKEWIAQVEPGVLITFVALADGANDLKRIRFSREIFNKWQAQQWWEENSEKVHELYNVSRYNRSTGSLPVPSRSEDETWQCKTTPEREYRPVSAEDSPHKHCQNYDYLPNGVYHSGALTLKAYKSATGEGCSQSGARGLSSLGHSGELVRGEQEGMIHTTRTSSSCQVTSTTSDMDADRTDDLQSSGERVSMSNASDQEIEWVEEDDPGVYITLRSMPGGIRELRRVRFSREAFTEIQARMWWEENRIRIREQYL